MSFTLEITKEQECICVTAIGVRNFENVREIAAEIVRAGIQHRRSRVVIDICQLKGSLEMLEAYDLATKVLSKFRGKWMQRTAVVDLPEARERYEFFENVAVNRGYYIRVFTDGKAAKEWLCK